MTYLRFRTPDRRFPMLASVLPGVALLFVLGAGCDMGRFPVCNSNDECKSEGKNRICFNLKCVQCQYDTDCDTGYTCNTSNECKSLGGEGMTADAGSRAWGPATWNECAKGCDNPDCVKACDEQFQK